MESTYDCTDPSFSTIRILLVLSYSALDSLSYTLNDTNDDDDTDDDDDDEEEEESAIGSEDDGNACIVVDGE